jgi:DNA-binding MarR family transcriptional regulator
MNSLLLLETIAAFSRLFTETISKKIDGLDIDRYYIVLVTIANSKEKLTQQDICEILHIDRAMMVKKIDYLSLHNYVKRIVNPNDRRERIIVLTSKARKTLPRIEATYSAITDTAFNKIKKEENEVFFRVLEKVNKTLREIPYNRIVKKDKVANVTHLNKL